ncbi:hypothetical protein IGI37_000979 [Enterococcus sp. AZ194]|uniref:hypothetical protein n=1 Tax=Enterococcus sp. AZ194 TaxID=2774629 RepID=UPI003F24A7F1
MKTWESYRAEAEKARREGDSEKELRILKRLIHQLAWTNDYWREIADFVYYNKLNSIVKHTSDSFQLIYMIPVFRAQFADLFK